MHAHIALAGPAIGGLELRPHGPRSAAHTSRRGSRPLSTLLSLSDLWL